MAEVAEVAVAKDPMAVVDRISWPVTASVHTMRRGRRVLVLGDYHRSLRGTCDACDPPKCATINELLHDLVRWGRASRTHLDVFLELPLPPKAADDRRRLLAEHDELYKSRIDSTWARMRQTLLGWAKLDYVMGWHSGYIYEVYHEFRHAFMHTQRGAGGGGARFHCADARVRSLLTALGMDLHGVMFGADGRVHGSDAIKVQAMRRFFQTYSSIRQLDDVIRALCVARAFAPAARAAGLPDAVLSKALRHPLIRGGRSKTAKQVWKLGVRERALLEGLVPVTAVPEEDEALFREMRADVLEGGAGMRGLNVARVLLLHKTLAVMDVYMVARMLHYMHLQPSGSTTVVFVGDAHADTVRALLARHPAHVRSRVCARPHVLEGDVKRCVRVAGCGPRAAVKGDVADMAGARAGRSKAAGAAAKGRSKAGAAARGRSKAAGPLQRTVSSALSSPRPQ